MTMPIIHHLSETHSPLSSGQRMGFHYFPDTLHYREADLAMWLPRLKALDAAWIILQSETGRAIPEAFLYGLKQAGIEPIVHFARATPTATNVAFDLCEVRPLLEVYARWGVHYVIFYDRPNVRSTWPSRNWVQQDPVKSFVDRFLPVANLALSFGLTPIFPPLEPGGSYWDTAFLRTALEEMERREQDDLLRNLALSAYAWTGGHPLHWGQGGPERWPQARAYQVSPEGQDQRGFRIFDWYEAIAQAALRRSCPIFLLQAGNPSDPTTGEDAADEKTLLAIGKMLAQRPATLTEEEEEQITSEPLPPQVVACCFWLLAAEETQPYHAHAWFTLQTDSQGSIQESALAAAWRKRQIAKASLPKVTPTSQALIRHYLLLPGYEWGVSDWYLEISRPFIKKFRPTIGFSLQEARLSDRVTVVGNVPGFTREALVELQKQGCEVEWIDGDGTTIATQLAER